MTGEPPPGGGLLLRGGTVLDGTGAPGRTADVAVADGRITAVGERLPAGTARVLDVAGAVVCPGFIDLHSHADFTVMATPGAPTQTAQGVTTLVTGNCGFSPFPLVPEHAAELRELCAFLDDGLSWEWSTAREYADAVDRLPLGVNIVPQVGHGSLRIAAMGTADRAPTESELSRMRQLVRDCAADGVAGLSSGLVYPPGSYAATEELVALVTEMTAHGGRLHSTHMRNEGVRLLPAVEEALTIARRGGARLQISHLKAAGAASWGSVGAALELIDAARAEGLDVAADQYPYSASSTTLTSQLPDWAMDGGVAALLARLADPERYRRLETELAQGPFRPERVVLAGLPEGPYDRYVGRSLADAAAALGRSPERTLLDVLAAHRAQVAIVSHSMSEDDVRLVMRHPAVAVASDGWVLHCPGTGRPHPRSFGTFARVLGRYTRTERNLGLPEAVRKMTALPASRLGWTDRGVLRPGAVADLAVFDPATVTDHATYDDPWRTATGVLHTLIAGRPVVEDGAATGTPAGRVLRRTGGA